MSINAVPLPFQLKDAHLATQTQNQNSSSSSAGQGQGRGQGYEHEPEQDESIEFMRDGQRDSELGAAGRISLQSVGASHKAAGAGAFGLGLDDGTEGGFASRFSDASR